MESFPREPTKIMLPTTIPLPASATTMASVYRFIEALRINTDVLHGTQERFFTRLLAGRFPQNR